MPQTKRKRRTKHRGNAAGKIVARGDTGRRTSGPDPRLDPRATQTKGGKPAGARERRANRFDQPPSWRGAIGRALVATVIFGVVIVAFFGQPLTAAIPLTFFMLAIYVPMGYYTDLFFYRRRQKQKAKAA